MLYSYLQLWESWPLGSSQLDTSQRVNPSSESLCRPNSGVFGLGTRILLIHSPKDSSILVKLKLTVNHIYLARWCQKLIFRRTGGEGGKRQSGQPPDQYRRLQSCTSNYVMTNISSIIFILNVINSEWIINIPTITLHLACAYYYGILKKNLPDQYMVSSTHGRDSHWLQRWRVKLCQ